MFRSKRYIILKRRIWCHGVGIMASLSTTRRPKCWYSRNHQASIHSPTTLFHPVHVVDQIKILGVTFQNNLSWNDHVKEVSKAAARRIFILKTLKKIPGVTKHDLVTIYNSILVTVLEYNSPLLIGMTKENSNTLEKIRKRCHRIICGSDCDCDCLPPLSNRRETQAMKTFKQMLSSDHICHSLIPHILPRTQHFFIPYTRTERRLRSFVPALCLRWNSLLWNYFTPRCNLFCALSLKLSEICLSLCTFV